MDEIMEGEIVNELLPRDPNNIYITRKELGRLLFEASALAFQAAEARRQYHAVTPDGRHDKTIRNYKPVPYHQALSESSTLKDIPYTGTEIWLGDSINPIPSTCADTLFLNYPKPLLLAERVSSAETSQRTCTRQTEKEDDETEGVNQGRIQV